MREIGFEPMKALSYLVLSQVRLTAPAFPLKELNNISFKNSP